MGYDPFPGWSVHGAPGDVRSRGQIVRGTRPRNGFQQSNGDATSDLDAGTDADLYAHDDVNSHSADGNLGACHSYPKAANGNADDDACPAHGAAERQGHGYPNSHPNRVAHSNQDAVVNRGEAVFN